MKDNKNLHQGKKQNGISQLFDVQKMVTELRREVVCLKAQRRALNWALCVAANKICTLDPTEVQWLTLQAKLRQLGFDAD
jgi:hypothetical protein